MRTQISCLPVSLYPEFFSGQRTVPEYSRQAKELDLDAIDINALFLREKSMEEIQQILDDLWAAAPAPSAEDFMTLPLVKRVMKIQEIIDKEIKPLLEQDGGGIELVDLQGTLVTVRLRGRSCQGARGTRARGASA